MYAARIRGAVLKERYSREIFIFVRVIGRTASRLERSITNQMGTVQNTHTDAHKKQVEKEERLFLAACEERKKSSNPWLLFSSSLLVLGDTKVFYIKKKLPKRLVLPIRRYGAVEYIFCPVNLLIPLQRPSYLFGVCSENKGCCFPTKSTGVLFPICENWIEIATQIAKRTTKEGPVDKSVVFFSCLLFLPRVVVIFPGYLIFIYICRITGHILCAKR